MGKRSRHDQSRGGLLAGLFRGLFSGDGPGLGSRKRRDIKARSLRFEPVEDRRLLSVQATWVAGSGTLTLTGDASGVPADDAVAVIGQSSYVDIYVSGHFQARLMNANSSNVKTINFDGGDGKDSLSVQNIQTNVPGTPPVTTLTIGLTDVEKLSVVKGTNAAVTSTFTTPGPALTLLTSSLSGALSVTTDGPLTQSGPVVVAGTTTLTAPATSDIKLTNAKNDFKKVVVTAGDNVSLVDVNSLVLGDSSVPAGVTLSGDLSVQASISSSSRGSLTQDGTITLIGTDKSSKFAVGKASTITLGDTANVLNTGTGSVAVASAGTASITNKGDTNLGASNVTGNFNVTTVLGGGASADITQAGSVVVGKIATFNVPDGENITLTTATNNFKTVVVTNAYDVSVRDVNGIVLGASTVDHDLSVTAAGQITQTGALNIAGNTTLNAGAANNITLSNAGNKLGTAAGAYVSIVAGRNVTLRDSDTTNGLDLGASTISGTLALTATGPITDSGQLDVKGKATFVATGTTPTMTLDGLGGAGDKFSQVAVTARGAVTLKDVDGGIALAKSTVSGTGTLTVTSTDGPITQTGAVVVAGGATSLTASDGAGTEYDIVLTNRSNNFLSVGVSAGKNVSLVDINAIQLAGLSLTGGNLSVTARGAVTQSGAAVTVPGSTTISAGRASSITLDGGSNALTGPASLTGGTATLTNGVATQFDTTNVLGNLTVDSTGAISQPGGPIVVGRTASFTASGADITLDNPANNFFVVAIPDGATVTLEDVNAVVLGTSSVATLNVTAGKSISQIGDGLTVTTAANFVAGPTAKDSIVLNNSGNTFDDTSVPSTSPVTLEAGGNVLLTNSDALELGAATVGGSLGVEAEGEITQTSGTTLDITGTTTLAADGNDITLTEANDFSVVSVTSGAVVQLTDSGAITLGLCEVSDNFTVIAGGPITQSDSVIANGGVTDLQAPGFDISMDLDGNDFDTIQLTSENATIVDTNELALGASTIGGNLGVTANGEITDAGAVIVGEKTTLAAGTLNDINLDTSDHEFHEISIESGYNVALNDVAPGGLILGTSDVTGALSVTAVGPISQDGPLSVTLTLTLDSGDSITLDDLDNLYGAVDVSASGDVTLFNNKDIVLGDATGVIVGGDLVVDVVGQISDGSVGGAAAVTVTGSTSLTARTASGAYKDIVLANVFSDYGGALSLVADNVSVENSAMATLTLGECSATGEFTVILNAAGAVLTNAPGGDGHFLTIDGKTTLKSTGSGGDIELYTAGCKFADWAFGDPTDFTSNLYLDAAIVNIYP